MMAEEEIAQLKKELATERAENAHLRRLLEEVLARLEEGEGKRAKDSHQFSPSN